MSEDKKPRFPKPTVGDIVTLRRTNHRGGYDKEPDSGEVTKVGRVYFYVKIRYNEYKIKLDDWLEYSEFGSPSQVYPSLQDYKDEGERQKLIRAIGMKFRMYGRLPYSIEQCRAVAKILEIKADD